VKAIALHLQLFASDEEGIRHLMKPEYHGNPIYPAVSFVVAERGDELCEFVLRSSGMTSASDRPTSFGPAAGWGKTGRH
jgi:hypothetical protein